MNGETPIVKYFNLKTLKIKVQQRLANVVERRAVTNATSLRTVTKKQNNWKHLGTFRDSGLTAHWPLIWDTHGKKLRPVLGHPDKQTRCDVRVPLYKSVHKRWGRGRRLDSQVTAVFTAKPINPRDTSQNKRGLKQSPLRILRNPAPKTGEYREATRVL